MLAQILYQGSRICMRHYGAAVGHDQNRDAAAQKFKRSRHLTRFDAPHLKEVFTAIC